MALSANQFPSFRNLPRRVYNRIIILLEMIALVLLVLLYIPTVALHFFGLWLTPARAVVLGVLTGLLLSYALGVGIFTVT